MSDFSCFVLFIGSIQNELFLKYIRGTDSNTPFFATCTLYCCWKVTHMNIFCTLNIAAAAVQHSQYSLTWFSSPRLLHNKWMIIINICNPRSELLVSSAVRYYNSHPQIVLWEIALTDLISYSSLWL